MGLLKHKYNLILALCMKRIFLRMGLLKHKYVQPNSSFVHDTYFVL
jgi:hypothetical protein